MSDTSLTEVQQREIDQLLLDNNPLRACKRIREFTKFGYNACGDIMRSRYNHLRQVCTEKFTQTDEEYWSGWGGGDS